MMSPRTAALILLLAIAVAAFLRIWRLDSMPPGFYHDEAYNALDALALLEGQTFPQFHEGWELYRIEAHGERGPQTARFPLFFEGNFGREPLHVYLMAASMGVLGRSVFAARLVPALAGVLAVVACASAAGMLAPKQDRFATIAFTAFACAILFPAVHFSRFGLRAMLFVPVAAWCVGAFWHGMQLVTQTQLGAANWGERLPLFAERMRLSLFPRTTLRRFLMAGCLLGFGLYIYAAGRMMPLVFVLFCGWYLWHDWRQVRTFSRAHANPIGLFVIMALVALLVVTPLLIYFYNYPYFLFARSAYVAQNGAGVVDGRPWLTAWLNVGRVLRGFIWLGETHLRHNLPGRPYFDLIQLGLFLTGLGVVLRRWKKPERMFVLIWGVVMLLPSILSSDAPHFGRLTGFVPVASLLIGVGAAVLWRVLSERVSAKAAPLVLGMLLVSMLWTARDYFVRYASHRQISADFYQPDLDLGSWMASQPDADFFLTPTRQHVATYLFALGDRRDQLRNYAFADSSTLYGQPTSPTIHVVPADEAALIDRLTARDDAVSVALPVAGWKGVQIRPNVPIFTEQVGSVEMAADVTNSAETLTVTLNWRPTLTLSDNYTAFVHILDADGNLIAQTDRPPAGYPTSDWRVGEVVRDRFVVSSPACETCQIVTGFYLPTSGERLGNPVRISD